MRRQIGWVMIFGLAALLVRAIPACTQSGTEVKLTSDVDMNAVARSTPAAETLDTWSDLLVKGYVVIGTIRAEEMESIGKPKAAITTELNSAIEQKAAEAGGELVLFNKNGVETTKEIPKGKPRATGGCVKYQQVPDGRGGMMQSTNCIQSSGYTQDTYTEYYLVSEASVWRHIDNATPAALISNFESLLIFDHNGLSIEKFLKDNPTLITAHNKDGWTLLHVAAHDTNTTAIQLLLDRGADVNSRANDGSTPLHFAIQRDRGTESAALLLTHGADINARDKQGNTPLNLAVRDSITYMIQFLLDRGANVNSPANDGSTPLHFATQSVKSNEITALLLVHGADMNARNDQGDTPLHLAAREGRTEMVQLLLGKGANVNLRDGIACTPLHWAAYSGQKEIAALLITQGADVNAKDKEGDTPLHTLAQEGPPAWAAVAELLLSKGADINARNNAAHTPLDEAQLRSHKVMAQWLKAHGANK